MPDRFRGDPVLRRLLRRADVLAEWLNHGVRVLQPQEEFGSASQSCGRATAWFPVVSRLIGVSATLNHQFGFSDRRLFLSEARRSPSILDPGEGGPPSDRLKHRDHIRVGR